MDEGSILKQDFKTIINADHHILDLHIKETISYRDLIFLFVKRDFVSKYKQTILGPAWAIIQPLLTTLVFTVVFGRLAGLSRSDIEGAYILPGFLFYMAGNICWSYFSATLSSTSSTFISNAAIMGKVYYPRLVTPIAIAFSNFISFIIQFFVFVIILAYYIMRGDTSIILTVKILLVPITVLELMILSVGCGIIVSSVTTKYRDMQMLVSFGLQLWQYASPIAYGLTLISSAGSGKYMTIFMLNPITPIITTFRYAVFGFGYFNMFYYSISWLISVLIFVIGLILFSRIERTFMDTI